MPRPVVAVAEPRALAKVRPPVRTPRVRVDHDICAIREQAERFLLARPDLEVYQRASDPPQLITINRLPVPGTEHGIKRAQGSPVLGNLTITQLQEKLSEAAEWMSKNRSGEWARARPPVWVAKTLLEHGQWPFRPLARVIESPTLRPDGTVLDVPGYDAETGLLYSPAPGVRFPDVPEQPDQAAAERALLHLSEVVCDFPFQEPHHRSVALAALITPIVRSAITGCVPLFAFDATTPGSGKSLLADCVAMILSGRVAARTPPTGNEEMEKRITSLLLAGDPTCLIDNVERPLGGGALDAAITAERWSTRLLGTNTWVRLLMTVTFFVTGNNLRVRGDMARRTLRAYLVPACERPEERADFKHTPLLPWVKANRGRLLTSALTVVRAYVVAGYPDVALKPMGSFETWSRLVRAPLVWLGQQDPLRSQEEVRAHADMERTALAGVLRGLQAMFGREPFTVGSLVSALDDGTAPDHIDLEATLQDVAPKKGGRWDTRRLGSAFRRHQGRIVGGLRVAKAEGPKRYGTWWCVEAVTQAAADSCG
jgi:putative DNA primase/helicase